MVFWRFVSDEIWVFWVGKDECSVKYFVGSVEEVVVVICEVFDVFVVEFFEEFLGVGFW